VVVVGSSGSSRQPPVIVAFVVDVAVEDSETRGFEFAALTERSKQLTSGQMLDDYLLNLAPFLVGL
jgi:hypothetical protein